MLIISKKIKMNNKKDKRKAPRSIIYCIVEGMKNTTEAKLLRGLSSEQQKYCFKVVQSHPDVVHMYETAVSKVRLCQKQDFVVILLDSDPITNPKRIPEIVCTNGKKKEDKIHFYVSDPCIENFLLSYFRVAAEEENSQKMIKLLSKYISHYEKCENFDFYQKLPKKDACADHEKAINNYRSGIGEGPYPTIADFLELVFCPEKKDQSNQRKERCSKSDC